MINKLKNKFTSLRPIDFAIVINAIGLNFMKFVPFGLIILVVASVYEILITKTALNDVQWNSKKKSFFILTIPFSLAVLGLIHTSNFPKGFEDIGRLLPFLAFPILLFRVSEERKNKLMSLVLYGFLFGLFIRFVLDFYESTLGYFYDYNIQIFFYTYLDSDTNILAIITMFAVLYLLDYLVSNTPQSLKRSIFIHAIILFLSLCVLLLQSRIVILFFFAALGVLFLYNWNKKQKWSVLLTVVFSGLLMLIPAFQGRFQVVSAESESITKVANESINDSIPVENLPCMSSTQLRYNSLKTSWKIIKKNPIFGVGTGDWRDELVKEYVASDMPCNAHEQTAPHNQYMRTMLKYGIVGLIIYLGYLFQLFKISRNRYRFGQIPFLLTLIFCGLGYDLIDVGSSAPVFAFFSTWLFFDKKS